MTDLAILEKFFLKMMKKVEEKPIVPMEYQLWDEHDIAAYFKYSLEYAKRHIISNDKFPPSRDLPTSATNDRTVPRWKAMDVIKFAMAFDKNTLTYH
ncbi:MULTISPECIES: hypothetical protein [unclassified Acinetobacter]|uniref:hypothetical protein n=1 Tax=unclassified Acinetobacter TaxID=196816 RepID=UPI0022AC0431|nr:MULTISPECIES: hypothetical protein [unclassified Acinetobacter]WAU72985.1 hypothetical protein O1450_12950 [Acinetobacter sp. TR11]WAU76078.1 hypothetical protein O1449_12460 [Acinetobacter sp. TR3]